MSPAIYTMFSHWVPNNEKSTALALMTVGGNIGTVLTMPLSGYLCAHGFAGGWPSVFYVLGVMGCLCFGLWLYIIYDTPADNPRITGKELVYIETHIDISSKNKQKILKKSVPWGQMLTSKQLWSVAMAKFCGAWGQLMLMSKLPAYLESVLHFSITEVSQH